MYLKDLPAANSIKCGCSYIPTKSIANHLTYFVRPVFIEHESAIDYLGVSGSSSLIKISGIRYICITRHQVHLEKGDIPENSSLDSVRIARISNGQRLENILFDQVIYCKDIDDEEYEDIVLLKAENQNFDGNPDNPFYMPLDKGSKGRYISSVAVGYPLEPIKMNYVSGSEKYGNAIVYPAVINAKRLKQGSLKGKWLKSYSKEYIERVPHNGFSGGAIFDFYHDENEIYCILGGIIIRGGNHHLHVIEPNYLKDLIFQD